MSDVVDVQPPLSEAERRAIIQLETNETIGELRELYRLVHMFPFYRYKARNELGNQLTSQLRMICKSRELPDTGADWRMRKPDFERLLRRFVETRGVSSVDEALDVAHVNELHSRWVALAREKNFDLGARPRSLFELGLAWALKFGGPSVQDRWVHAKPYQTTDARRVSR